jgi:hypothetical protein
MIYSSIVKLGKPISHLVHVDQVLHLLSRHKLFLKYSKCSFGVFELEYLGHILRKDGVQVDIEKIEAMKDWPYPKNIKILCELLGLTRYYRKFVHNYGNNVAPLTSCLKMIFFSWNPTVDRSFHGLKEAMCMNHVMELPDFTKNFFHRM